MACQSFHQVEIEGDHKYLTYIVITLPDAYMYVLCNTEQTSALSDSTIFAIFVLSDSTKYRYRRGTFLRQNRVQKIVLYDRVFKIVLYNVVDSQACTRSIVIYTY